MSEDPLNGDGLIEASDDEGTAAEPGQDAEIIQLPTAAAAPVKPQRGLPGEWKPVVPEHLRTREGRRKAAAWQVKRAKHHTAYHGVRSPLRLFSTLWWALVGLLKIVYVQLGWWWVAEQTLLRHTAIADGDTDKYLRLHKHAREVRLVRGVILLAELAALTGAGVWVSLQSLLWWIPIGLVLVPLLAWVGRPDDKPIVTSAVVPAAVDRITIELIVRSLGALGIAEMNKALRLDPAKAIVTIDGPMRDAAGWLWRGDLPPGVTAGDVSDKRAELASGLRRPLGCVWPDTEHKRHPGALALYVSDEDMTTAEQPAWPLVKRGIVDLFKPQLIGYDPRGRAVMVTLMFVSGIIGSLPRMGKTFLLRLLLLICALDPRCEIHAYDLKGTGDLAPLRPVAHRYRAGDDDEDIEYLLADLEEMHLDLRRRRNVLREYAEKYPELCPENKITTEMASDPRLGLHPVALALDECQRAFEHKLYGADPGDHRGPGPPRPRARVHHPAGHPAGRREVNPARHQRERRPPLVPEGHGPGGERHGDGHVRLQVGHQGDHVRRRRQGGLLLRRRGDARPDHAQPVRQRRARPRRRSPRLRAAQGSRPDHRVRGQPGPGPGPLVRR